MLWILCLSTGSLKERLESLTSDVNFNNDNNNMLRLEIWLVPSSLAKVDRFDVRVKISGQFFRFYLTK